MTWRRIARTYLPELRELVSTVFYDGSYETMVFPARKDGHKIWTTSPNERLCRRYRTRAEAREGHKAIVAERKATSSPT